MLAVLTATLRHNVPATACCMLHCTVQKWRAAEHTVEAPVAKAHSSGLALPLFICRCLCGASAHSLRRGMWLGSFMAWLASLMRKAVRMTQIRGTANANASSCTMAARR